MAPKITGTERTVFDYGKAVLCSNIHQRSHLMNNKLNSKERLHLANVKELPCSVCDAPGPSDAHHVKQGLQYTCIALCKDCHQGSILGWHGQKRAWSIRKMDELGALNITIERLINGIR